MAKLDDYLTVADCAKELGCSPRTVENYILDGHISVAKRIGNTRLIQRKQCKRPAGKLDARGSNNFGKKRKEAN